VSFIGGADCSEAEDQQVPLLNCKSDLFCFFFLRQKKRREKKNSTLYLRHSTDIFTLKESYFCISTFI